MSDPKAGVPPEDITKAESVDESGSPLSEDVQDGNAGGTGSQVTRNPSSGNQDAGAPKDIKGDAPDGTARK